MEGSQAEGGRTAVNDILIMYETMETCESNLFLITGIPAFHMHLRKNANQTRKNLFTSCLLATR